MNATDEMKMYLNSILNKIDADIHNELWEKLITIIAENERLKNCSMPDVSTRIEMREQAMTVFELTQGFTGELTDNAMKAALEMADYVMQLTSDL